MGLFKPEIGLVFWMLVVFLIILAILAKYAWPVIIRSIEQRADFIDSGVKFTREAMHGFCTVTQDAQVDFRCKIRQGVHKLYAQKLRCFALK